ncbi:unnamed protein product [Camellia sinensis]
MINGCHSFIVCRHPEVKWAQRLDKVYITVLLPDAKNAKVKLEPDGSFIFSASAGAENHLYELKLDLFEKVNVEESKINVGMRSIFCVLEKAEMKWWKKLSRGDEKVPHYVKVDWDKWVDEDDDTGPADLDLGGMDFSKFGDVGGMGDDLDYSDEDDEMAMPEEQDAGEAGGEVKPEKHEASKVENAPEGKAEVAPSM